MDYTTKLSNNTNPSFDMTKVFDTKIISKEFDDITNSYYKQGYEDAVNKACEWLLEYVNEYVINDRYELPNGKMSREWLKVKSEMFGDFKKAMEQ